MTNKKVSKAVKVEPVAEVKKPKLTNKQRGALKRAENANGLAKQADLTDCNKQSLEKNTKTAK